MKKLILALAAMAAAAAPLCAGELDVRMAKTVKTFSSAARELGLSTATLAVLPFRTDKKLAEQRVDYACGELLTNRFKANGGFRVVERARLDALLKEQALGAGGVTESAAAARLGQLLGAKLVIIGSVSRLGSSYHMSTEMVDAETGEILASDVTEVEVQTFDKDAGSYLVLVPDYDALGIYLAGGFGPASNVKKFDPVVSGGQTVTPRNVDPVMCRYYGVGLRYFISPKWMADGAVMLSLMMGAEYGASSTSGTVYMPDDMGGSLVRLLFNRALPLSEKFKAYAGAGATILNVGDRNTDNVKLTADGRVMPTLRGTLEWKPKPRFAVSLSGLYQFSPATIKMKTEDSAALLIRQFDFPDLMAEANVSVYF